MSEERWIEVNIQLRDYVLTRQVLLRFVKGYVEEFKAKYNLISWHYLLEPEIRLRFYASNDSANRIKDELDTKLGSLETAHQGVYLSHSFGRHGDSSKEYAGEFDSYGDRGWPIFMQFLQNCSETALSFLENEPKDACEKPWGYYVERFTHLMLNQIGVHTYVAKKTIGEFASTQLLFVPLEEGRL